MAHHSAVDKWEVSSQPRGSEVNKTLRERAQCKKRDSVNKCWWPRCVFVENLIALSLSFQTQSLQTQFPPDAKEHNCFSKQESATQLSLGASEPCLNLQFGIV